MPTVNNRIKRIYNATLNGIAAGGAVSATIQKGYDQTISSRPDGLEVPIVDRSVEFCRGSLVTEDWSQIINILNGTLGTFTFYQRTSGVPTATGYVKHTLVNPVIHRIGLNITGGKNKQFFTATADFECKAADETKGFADMHFPTAAQALPVPVAAARGFQTLTTAHGATPIYHLLSLSFNLTLKLDIDHNDGDVGYTAVDAELDAIQAGGSINFQDASIAAGPPQSFLADDLLAAAKADLVLTLKQSQGAASKTLTLANALFTSGGPSPDANQEFDATKLNFQIANDAGTPLTLTGTNKIITIV